jgi:hypothetical protein
MPTSGEPTNLDLLRQEIARRLDTLSLPIANRPKIFGGRGENQLCACCGTPIANSNVLYDIEMDEGSARIDLPMHLWCFNIWMEESLVRHHQADNR